ncbi:MAG: multidrug effflux MFS transporter [Parachlamydiaceae bacterium]|nr:multidrug effflux MFS transporter [Parachlamydiaceae bacterium]
MFKKLAKTSPLIPIIFIIALIACWIELDLYAPSFPQIMHHFETNEQAIQWTLSLNFLGFFLSSLFCGPLADGFGRRPILVTGSIIFALGSIVCVFAPSMEILMLGRFIQGMGVSAPVTICMAVIADIYQGDRQVRLLSIMNSTVTMVMAAAPIAGVFLTEYFGWRSNFVVIAIGAFLGTFLIGFFIPETHEKDKRQPFEIKQLFMGYVQLLKCKSFMLLTLSLCFMTAAYFVFIGIIPLLFMEKLGVDINSYALYQGSGVGLFAILSLCVPTVMSKFNVDKLMRASMIVSLASGISLGLLGIFAADHPQSITILMCCYIVGLVLPCCVVFAQAMDMFPPLRASASSLMQSLRMLTMALATYLAGFFYDGSFMPIGIVIMSLIVMAFPMAMSVIGRRNLASLQPSTGAFH